MSKNYYCSGFDINNAFKEEFSKYLKTDLKQTKRIVYIPGSNRKEKLEKTFSTYVPAFTEHFKKIGITFDDVKVVTPEVTSEEAQNWVSDSDLVMLMGGNPFLQRDLFKSKGLTELLKNYDGVIIGMSAGAMNMSKYIIITPCSAEYPEFQIEEGLNLSDISVYPHINFNGNEIPYNIDLGKENIIMKDLSTVAKKYGDFYCLQDHFDGVKTNVSFIYEKDKDLKYIIENEGKVILVSNNDFVFCNVTERNKLK